MTREREIFLQALEQPIEARSSFVERATAGDPELKEAVEALLANNQADTFLERGVAGLLRRVDGCGMAAANRWSRRGRRNWLRCRRRPMSGL